MQMWTDEPGLQASWKGPSSFNWAGPEHGYVVQTRPKGYDPEELPEFSKLTDQELIDLFEGESWFVLLLPCGCYSGVNILPRPRAYSVNSWLIPPRNPLRLFFPHTYHSGNFLQRIQFAIDHLRPFAEDATLLPL